MRQRYERIAHEAWWQGHGNRLFYILRPPPTICGAVEASIRDVQLESLLCPAWPKDCWHQSASDRYADEPWIRERLIAAGDHVRAVGFDLELDRVRAAQHAEIRAGGGCAGLKRLMDALCQATAAQGLPWGGNHSPHLTLDYRHDGPDVSSRLPRPVVWPVNAFELVVGGGKPYRYTTLARWQLDPPPVRAVQTDLFS